MPNWNEINRCPIWKVLGVCECDNCNTEKDCWGDEVELIQEGGKMTCPINLDKIHCQNCYFNPQGECKYKEMTNASDKQTDRSGKH